MSTSGSNYEHIVFDQQRARATITFNRVEVLNALNEKLIHETLDAVAHVAPCTKVLIIRGAGSKAFAAGADIRELQRRTAWTELDYGPRRELARRLEHAPFLTVAALNGLALGGGMEIALACHLRVASATATFGLPELRLGLIPGNGGTARLPRLVGRGRALKAILLSERLGAEEACQLGLVDWMVPAEEFDARVDELAAQIEKLPPVAMRAVIDCVVQGGDMPLDHAIEREHRWFQLCLSSADRAEGVAAFLEKREPHFATVP